jgi:phage shock protein E
MRLAPVRRTWVGQVLLAGLLFSGCGANGLGPFVTLPEVSPVELTARLSDRASPPRVIDLRGEAAFEAGHVPGALRLSVDELDGYLVRTGAGAQPLVLACDLGDLAKVGVTIARRRGLNAKVLAGGMERWPKDLRLATGPAPAIAPELLRPPELHLGFAEQAVTAVAWFGVKTTYMLLSLVLLVILWGKPGRVLLLFRLGLLWFLIGEALCWVNISFYDGRSRTMELLHGLGMIGFFAYLMWGLSHLVDHAVLGYSEPKAPCVAIRLCRKCWKKEAVPCGIHRTLLFAAPAAAIVALMPLTAPLSPASYLIPIFGTPIHWAVDLHMQLVEFRLYPVIGAVLLLVSFFMLLGGRAWVARSQAPFFIGLGFAFFALFRFIVFRAYWDVPVWADAWEELTELLAVVFLAAVLWAFRGPLGITPWVRRA